MEKLHKQPSNGTIFLIEDDATEAQTFIKAAKKVKLSVVWAKNADEALAKMDEFIKSGTKPAFIVTDNSFPAAKIMYEPEYASYRGPVVSNNAGLILAKILHDHPVFADVPVVMSTSMPTVQVEKFHKSVGIEYIHTDKEDPGNLLHDIAEKILSKKKETPDLTVITKDKEHDKIGGQGAGNHHHGAFTV